MNNSFTLDSQDGEVRVALSCKNKQTLVLQAGLKLTHTRGYKLELSRGVSGRPGINGAYNTPEPTTIVDGTTHVIPAGKQLQGIAILPETDDRVLTVGYSAGAGEVIDNEEVNGDDAGFFLIGKFYPTAKTIHFSGFEGEVLIFIL